MALTLITTTDGFQLDISDELWHIRQFKKYLEKRFKTFSDKEDAKELILKELGFLYFNYNPESDFASQVDEELRRLEVIDYMGLPLSWKEDEYFKDILKAYLGPESLFDKLLKTARISTDKINNQLNNIDLDERDKSGKPIYNLKQFNDTIKQLPETMEALDKAEKMYIKNKSEKTNLKGGKEKSMFEDGI